MSELNKRFPEILLAYIADVGCEFSNSRINELSKFVSELELEIENLKTRCAAYENDLVLIEVNEMLKNKQARVQELEIYNKDFHLACINALDLHRESDVPKLKDIPKIIEELRTRVQELEVAISNQSALVYKFENMASDLQSENDLLKNNPEAEKYYYQKWVEGKQRIAELELLQFERQTWIDKVDVLQKRTIEQYQEIERQQARIEELEKEKRDILIVFDDNITRRDERIEELEMFQDLVNRWSDQYYRDTNKLKQRIAELEEALAKIANYESMRFRLSPYEYGVLEQIVGIAEHALKGEK